MCDEEEFRECECGEEIPYEDDYCETCQKEIEELQAYEEHGDLQMRYDKENRDE